MLAYVPCLFSCACVVFSIFFRVSCACVCLVFFCHLPVSFDFFVYSADWYCQFRCLCDICESFYLCLCNIICLLSCACVILVVFFYLLSCNWVILFVHVGVKVFLDKFLCCFLGV